MEIVRVVTPICPARLRRGEQIHKNRLTTVYMGTAPWLGTQYPAAHSELWNHGLLGA
jgi:hypothetical protein